MTLKLKRTFTDSLKNAKSDDYAQLSGSIQRAVSQKRIWKNLISIRHIFVLHIIPCMVFGAELTYFASCFNMATHKAMSLSFLVSVIFLNSFLISFVSNT